MIYDFFSLTLALFLLMDPLGNVPLFLSLLKNFPAKQQRKIILRELVFALILLFAFFFVGAEILEFIHIQEHTIFIGGGVILFIIAIRMLFPSSEEKREDPLSQEPIIVPLAIPLVAGPAALAAVIIYAKNGLGRQIVSWAILLAWAAATIILLCAPWLQARLGSRGIAALERIMGFLLVLLSIQMLLDGCSLYIQKVSLFLPHAS